MTQAFEEMEYIPLRELATKDCLQCYGTGSYPARFGDDDYQMEICDCVIANSHEQGK